MTIENLSVFSSLFGLILSIPVNIFQSGRDGSSWVEWVKCHAQGHNTVTLQAVQLKLTIL